MSPTSNAGDVRVEAEGETEAMFSNIVRAGASARVGAGGTGSFTPSLDALSGIQNLYSIGRQGLFLQNDMHDSMEMGRMAAEYGAKNAPSGHWYDFMMDYWKLSDRQPLL